MIDPTRRRVTIRRRRSYRFDFEPLPRRPAVALDWGGRDNEGRPLTVPTSREVTGLLRHFAARPTLADAVSARKPLGGPTQMALSKLEKFAKLAALLDREVLTAGALLCQVTDHDHLCDSPNDLAAILDASPPALVAAFRAWADSYPVDDVGWASWMAKEFFPVFTDAAKQRHRMLVERFRQWFGVAGNKEKDRS